MQSYVNATAIFLMQFCETVHMVRLQFISFCMNHTSQLLRMGMEPIHV